MHVSASLLLVSAMAAVLGQAVTGDSPLKQSNHTVKGAVTGDKANASYPYIGSYANLVLKILKKNGILIWNKSLSKKARIAPSPERMWAIIDPPGSLGDLGDSILTNRIARSLKSIDEVEEREEVENDSRVVRSVNNRREARQEGEEEDATEAPEAPEAPEATEATEAPEAPEEENATEPPEDVTEEPVEEVEEETEPPVTTPAPVICGGDLTPSLDPNTVQTDGEGRFFNEHILSPGYEEGEYPDQGFECEWTIGVGEECSMGMIMFVINEGEIRETARCTEDHLAVSYRDQQENKFCGMLRQGQHQVTGTDIWTEPTPLAMKITFRAAERGFTPSIRSDGKPVGFNMTISSYCWAWSPDFLAGKTTSTTTTTTTTTTTEAPSDEPVTTISEDGQGYEDENPEGEDTATTAPQQDGFEESGERFSDVSNDLEPIDGPSNSWAPELSSASSIGSLSSIASLISPQEDSNILDVDTPDTDVLNTEALNPIISEAELLPPAPAQSDPVSIIPSGLSPSQDDATTPEESSPIDIKPVPVDSNPQVSKPTPSNSNKPTGSKKPNKKPNKKPTKPSGGLIPFVPLRDDSNIMDGDTPYPGEKINFAPIIDQLLAA